MPLRDPSILVNPGCPPATLSSRHLKDPSSCHDGGGESVAQAAARKANTRAAEDVLLIMENAGW
jgi:hypothetical protein